MLLTRLKLPLVSKIVVKRALQSASKFCVREGYRAVARNRNYFELAKQATFVTKLINANGQKDVEEVSESEEKSEFSIFSFALESVIIFLRVVVITSVLTGLLTFYCVSRLLRLGHYPTVYLKAIEFLGPTFVKFGQWMSTRRDVYSAELCDCLATLQRDSSAHSWHYTRHLLEATYGPNWRDLFPIFETSPVGSGCCAQVHRAFIDPSRYRDRVKSYPTVPVYVDVAEFLYLGYLIDHFSKTSVYTSFQPGVLPSETLNNRLFPGNSDKAKRNTFSFPVELRPVAVKVLHPRTGERLRQDLKILRFVSKCAQFIVPSLKWLSISESVDDFSEIMAKQVSER